MPDVADDTDNRDVGAEEHVNALTEGVLSGPELPGRGFAHDSHGRRLRRIEAGRIRLLGIPPDHGHR